MEIFAEFKDSMDYAEKPHSLSNWMLHCEYITISEPNNKILERTEKYILKDFLPPVRYTSPGEEFDDDELLRMLVLYNTEDSKYYIGKWFVRGWYYESRAHEILDPLNCPYIIRAADKVVPRVFSWNCFLITPQYKQFDMEVLKQFPKLVLFQLLTALKVVHKNNLVHWDISTDNIVWEWEGSEPHIYLIDFDNSHEMTKPCTVFKFKYSVGYGLRGEEGRFEDGIQGYPADDMWCVGIILAELLLGQKRAFTKSTADTHSFRSGVLSRIKHCDPLAIDLVTKLLTDKPLDRLTARKALKHAYFTELRREDRKNQKRKRNSSPTQSVKKSRH